MNRMIPAGWDGENKGDGWPGETKENTWFHWLKMDPFGIG
jgi:hypothetical protein